MSRARRARSRAFQRYGVLGFFAGAILTAVLGWAGLGLRQTIDALDLRITRIEQFLTAVTSQPHGMSGMKVKE